MALSHLDALVQAEEFSGKWKTSVIVFRLPGIGPDDEAYAFVERGLFPKVRRQGIVSDTDVVAIFDNGRLIDDRS